MKRHQWLAADPKGTIVLVHGTGEHYGRYEHVAAFLNARGWSVFTGDLPGWGRSPGRKGHIDSFQQYVEAVDEWRRAAREASGGKQPLYILGHSLGGLVATRYVQCYERSEEELAGLILTSPCLALKLAVPPWKVKLAGWLDSIWPTLTMPNGITPDMVSRDEQVQAAYQSDPLNYAKVSVRWFQELHRAIDLAWKERDRISVPVLVLQAGEDSLIDAEAIERFAAGIRSDAEFHRWQGLRHEVLNEPEKEQVMFQVETWMNRQDRQM
ncbi:alpha/beta hydrolase [Brevibacillus choshinensis]|uniref:alpha/beta hydrolase n=1 Tax=Brevibacillus choshinensis TaxID=54911 RepID=UPI002E1B7844|nr:lysophospholipase [Brevibacillus choshinensis]